MNSTFLEPKKGDWFFWVESKNEFYLMQDGKQVNIYPGNEARFNQLKCFFGPEAKLQLKQLKELHEAFKENKTLIKLNFINSKQLMETPKEKGFVVQHIIQKNTVNQLLSPPASFKSLTAMYLAVCVSNKKDFLGFKTKKCSVAYLDKENNRQLLKDRLNGIVKGLKLRRKRFPLFFLLKEGMLDDENFVERLSDYIKENNVGLIIFDTLVRFNSGDENSARDMNKIYEAFIKLQNETKAAILFLHHTNRKGEFRGSSDLMGQVDTMFQIYRVKEANKFNIKNTKNRIGEINDIHAEIIFTEDSILFEKKEVEQEEEQEKYDKFVIARAFILDYAKEVCPTSVHPFKRADLLVALNAWNAEKEKDKQISKRLVDKTIKYLKDKRILRKGDKRGEFFLNNAENDKISQWISPLGLGNALNPEGCATTQTEDVA